MKKTLLFSLTGAFALLMGMVFSSSGIINRPTYNYTAQVVKPEVVPTPSVPSNLVALLVTPTSVDIEWIDNSHNEAGFMIERALGSYDKELESGFIRLGQVQAGVTRFTDSSVLANTIYSYRIRAFNKEGNSPYTDTISVITGEFPQSPTGLTATAELPTKVLLTWQDNSEDEVGFAIGKSFNGEEFSNIATVPANVTEYVDLFVTADTDYTYRIHAVGEYGESPYSEVATTTTPIEETVPWVPLSLSVKAISTDAIELTWTDNSINEEGFKIERARGASSFAIRDIVEKDTTKAIDDTVSPHTTYTYCVRSYNRAGASTCSNVVTITTGSKPNTPLRMNARAYSPTEIVLSWVDNSDNEQGFVIEKSENGKTFTELATQRANITSFRDLLVKKDTTYTYRVRAYNKYGNSFYSAKAEIITPDEDTVPNRPSHLLAIPAAPNKVKLQWNDNALNETGFEIQRSKNGIEFVILERLPADNNRYTDTSVSGGKTYFYRILAFNQIGNSAYTDTIGIDTPN